MEGGVTPDAMMVFIKEMRPKHPDWTFVYVPNAGEEAAAIPYDTKNKGLPDYVAPMLYAGNWNSYPGQDITNGEDSISGLTLQRLKQVGWPASRTILTYQSFDAARMRQEAKGGLLPLLGKLLGDYSVEVGGGQKVHLQGPYAGVLGWPSQCGAADFRCWPTADRANIKQVIEGARSAGVGGAAGVGRVWIGTGGLLSTPAMSAVIRTRSRGLEGQAPIGGKEHVTAHGDGTLFKTQAHRCRRAA